ncbi:MAG: orotidine-5'-phosphate decarboxylase [Deferribacterales bacterium]
MKPEMIVALDFDRADAAKKIVDMTGDAVTWYKVGLELFVADGRNIIEYLKKQDKKIFLDLKFHDIQNTVVSAVLASLQYETEMVNMHTQGGGDMMASVAERVSEHCAKTNVKKPLLIGVTLLTSLDEKYLQSMKIGFAQPKDYVLHLAAMAKQSGLDGVVSSAKETTFIKNALGSDFITVTPGIRPADASVDDQKRVVTPKDAKNMGTDYIVIGRPVTQAKDPAQAALKILEELN